MIATLKYGMIATLSAYTKYKYTVKGSPTLKNLLATFDLIFEVPYVHHMVVGIK